MDRNAFLSELMTCRSDLAQLQHGESAEAENASLKGMLLCLFPLCLCFLYEYVGIKEKKERVGT